MSTRSISVSRGARETEPYVCSSVGRRQRWLALMKINLVNDVGARRCRFVPLERGLMRRCRLARSF